MAEQFNAEIGSMWKYPVTGGPGIEIEEVAEVIKGGFYGDRMWIVAEETDSGLVRIGSKHAPKLLQIRYKNPYELSLDGYDVVLPMDESIDETPDTFCDEFGDATPVMFTNPDLDDAFSTFLDGEKKLNLFVKHWVGRWD